MYACIYACMQHVLVMKMDFQFDMHMYVCLRSIYIYYNITCFDSACMSAVVQAFHNEVIYCLSTFSLCPYYYSVCMYVCMYQKPQLVSELALAVYEGSGMPATIKCRIGVDDNDSYDNLTQFIEQVSSKGYYLG